MQLSAIVIGFLLVVLVSASNPGGYWTVYSSQECSSGTEILYSWFNAFPVRQLNYKFSLVDSSKYCRIPTTTTSTIFPAPNWALPLSITLLLRTLQASICRCLRLVTAGISTLLLLTAPMTLSLPISLLVRIRFICFVCFSTIRFTVKVGESCTAFEVWNGVGGEQFPTSFNFTECPASGNATYLTFSTFDCMDGATQTISGPSGQCYRDFNDYPRLIYCDNYESASTPHASPSSDAPISAPISTPTTTATPTRTPTATPAKKSDATLISLGLTTLVMAVASAV
jgi:hypothetical protein